MDMISSLLVPGIAAAREPFAAVGGLVCEECPHFAVAQTGLVKAHVRPDVRTVEIETTGQLIITPLMVTAQFITV